MSGAYLVSLGGSAYSRASRFRHDAFAASSRKVGNYLQAIGRGIVASGDHLDLFNRDDNAGEQVIVIRDWLRARTSQSPQNIIFHYVGHGYFRRNGGGYLLSINATDNEDYEITSLILRDLHEMMIRNFSNFRIFYLIDACFAEASLTNFMMGTPQQLLEDTVRRALNEGEDAAAGPNGERLLHAASGVAVLCSSAKTQFARAAGRRGLTQFTDGLIAALEAGDVDRPTSLISFQRLFHLTWEALKGRYNTSAVSPVLFEVDKTEGRIVDFPLFHNEAIETLRAALIRTPEPDAVPIRAKAAAIAQEIEQAAAEGVGFDEAIARVRTLGEAERSVGRAEDLRLPDWSEIVADLDRMRGDLSAICNPGRGLPLELDGWLGANWPSALMMFQKTLDPLKIVLTAKNAPERLRTRLELDCALTAEAETIARNAQDVMARQVLLASELETQLAQRIHAWSSGSDSSVPRLMRQPLGLAKQRVQVMIGELGIRTQLEAWLAARTAANRSEMARLDKLEKGFLGLVSSLEEMVVDLESCATARNALDMLAERGAALDPIVKELIDVAAAVGSTFDPSASLSISASTTSASDHEKVVLPHAGDDANTPALGPVHRMAAKIDLDPAIAVEPSTGAMIAISDVSRRFFGLPLSKKTEIAKRLNLLEEEDLRSPNMAQRFRFIMHRAYARGILDQLTEAVNLAERG